MIPLDLDENKVSESWKTALKTQKLLDRDFTKANLMTAHMAVFSSLLVDLVCIYIPLIQYTDHSLIEGFKLFVVNQDNRVSVFYYCHLVYLIVLYSGISLTFFWNNPVVLDVMRNWVNVGILLTLLSVPFSREIFIFKIATSVINLVCLRVRFEVSLSEI